MPACWGTIAALTFSGRTSRSPGGEHRTRSYDAIVRYDFDQEKWIFGAPQQCLYVGLALMPECGDGSKTVTLKRYGDYEVRLIDFSQGRSSADCLFWLELYCHTTRSSLDSCRCDDLDDAEAAADYLVSRAKQLHDGTA